ncbi:hypothetical protein Moror_5939 [Moniliophthora roreri MCA 2997]|uniref:Uncharacterized protein n=2 Tax=Moniliophthora roreri TaxID=221103 RepID=V2WEV2_MONRO|nr:hypothetical protein Moror_5939 [Moniliophthora roreri MCA 2997]
MFNNNRDFKIHGSAINNVGGDQVNHNGDSHNTHNDFRSANFKNENHGEGMMNTGVNNITAPTRRGQTKGNRKGRDSTVTPRRPRRSDNDEDHSSRSDDDDEDRQPHAQRAARALQVQAPNQLAWWQRLDELVLLRIFVFMTVLFVSVYFWNMYRAP